MLCFSSASSHSSSSGWAWHDSMLAPELKQYSAHSEHRVQYQLVSLARNFPDGVEQWTLVHTDSDGHVWQLYLRKRDRDSCTLKQSLLNTFYNFFYFCCHKLNWVIFYEEKLLVLNFKEFRKCYLAFIILFVLGTYT